MLDREIIENRTEHRNLLCGQNVELLYFKPVGTQSNHWLEGFRFFNVKIIESLDHYWSAILFSTCLIFGPNCCSLNWVDDYVSIEDSHYRFFFKKART